MNHRLPFKGLSSVKFILKNVFSIDALNWSKVMVITIYIAIYLDAVAANVVHSKLVTFEVPF